METFDTDTWVILPLLVFLARFVDVTLGTMRIILPQNGNSLVTRLREEGYGVTFVDGHGVSGPVVLVYTVVMRRELSQVITIIEDTSTKAFYTVEELRSVRQGIFPVRSSKLMGNLSGRKKK